MKKTLSKVFGPVAGLLSAVALLAALLASCSGKASDNRPLIMVSVEPLRNIARQLVGDDFRISTMMPGGDNPETFEPSPIRRAEAEKCDVYFAVGLLPFEETLKRSSANSENFADVSAGIDLLYDTHTHVHGNGDNARVHTHRAADPHVWTSVKNAKKIAANMAEKLRDVYPGHAAAIHANLERYLTHLDSLDASIAAKTADARGFLVWHPSLSYFAKDYRLRQVAVSSDTKEMSALSMANIIEQARADSIRVMFYQREFDGRQAEMIGKSINARLVPVSTAAFDWENELIKVADELAKQ